MSGGIVLFWILMAGIGTDLEVAGNLFPIYTHTYTRVFDLDIKDSNFWLKS